MARARNIKPGLLKNEVLGAADPIYTVLFVGLWTLADRAGRLEDRPIRIRGELFPYRVGIDIDQMLNWLVKNDFILRYRAQGVAVIQIINFEKHQNPHKNEAPSDLPSHDRSDASTTEKIGTTSEEIGSTRADSLSSDSGFLIPDCPTRSAPSAAAPLPTRKVRAKPLKTDMPEGFAVSKRVTAWADKNGFGHLDQHLEAFKRKVAAHAYRYADWDAALMEAIREDWAKLRGRSSVAGAAPPPEAVANPQVAKTAELFAEFDAHRAQATQPPPQLRALIGGAIKKVAAA